MTKKRSEKGRLDDCYRQAEEIFRDAKGAEVRRTGNTVQIVNPLSDTCRIIMDIFSRGELQMEDEWYRPDNPENAERFAKIFQAHAKVFIERLIQMKVYRSTDGEHYGEDYGFHGFLIGRLDTDIWKFELPVLRRLHDESVKAMKKILDV
jgi:hypothetical protein